MGRQKFYDKAAADARVIAYAKDLAAYLRKTDIKFYGDDPYEYALEAIIFGPLGLEEHGDRADELNNAISNWMEDRGYIFIGELRA